MLHTWVQEKFVEKIFTNQRETHVVASADRTPFFLSYNLLKKRFMGHIAYYTSTFIQKKKWRQQLKMHKVIIISPYKGSGLVSSFQNFDMIMLCSKSDWNWPIGYRKLRLLNAINAFWWYFAKYLFLKTGVVLYLNVELLCATFVWK
jgi:hypothetical protein